MHQRLEKLRKRMRLLGISNFIAVNVEQFKQSNVRYLCGYSGSNGLLWVTQRDAMFVTDSRYSEQAKQEVKNARVAIYSGGTNVSECFVNAVIGETKSPIRGKIGLENNLSTSELYNTVRDRFPKSEIVLVGGEVEKISAVKDTDEIDKIKKAVNITDIAFKEVLKLVKSGITERELAAEITYQHLLNGADKDSFEAIVASGSRSALPHGIASTKIIENGDFITFDIGCFYDGYASDMTRTVVLGKATEEQKKIYNIVLKAQLVALQAIKPGVNCADVDRVARDYISDQGYGNYFIHSLGHGLGHFVHELPVLSKLSKMKLEPGNIVTVEPGIYISDFGGVRIEDDVLVTDDGYEILNKSPKELIEIK